MPLNLKNLQAHVEKIVPAAPKIAVAEKSVENDRHPSPPEAFYQQKDKHFWIPDSGGGFVQLNEPSYRRYLRSLGMRAKKFDDELMSPIDSCILETQRSFHIAYAGPLAGYKKGLWTVLGNKVLVTSSPTFIEPVPGEWPILKQFMNGLLVGPGIDQLPFLYGWLKVAIEALRLGLRRPGQALAIAGPSTCGKSLFQNLITPLLGNRATNPYPYMIGETSFNRDWFSAEHLQIEDQAASKDIRARNKFGIQIKNLTVNQNQRDHGKHETAFYLDPFWRLTITLNDDEESLLVLPPLSESVQDKFILLQAFKRSLPMPTAELTDREALWDTLIRELPHFIDFLLKWEIPAELKCERFGVKSYVNPSVEKKLSNLAPEYRLLTDIDATLFDRPASPSYQGSAAQLEKRVTADNAPFTHDARKLLTGTNACGLYLARLVEKMPERFSSKRINGQTIYTILPPEYMPEVFDSFENHLDPEPEVKGCPKPLLKSSVLNKIRPVETPDSTTPLSTEIEESNELTVPPTIPE